MNILNSFFDKIVVITAKEHTNRIDYIKSYFKELEIIYDFHCAVNSDYLDDLHIQNHLNHLKNNNMKDTMNVSKYRMSATISHIQVSRQFQYSNYKNILIFEDDVFFTDDYQINLENFMGNIPNDWDILNLGRNYTYTETQVKKYNNFANIPIELFGAHAYALSKNKIEMYCDNFDVNGSLCWGPDLYLIRMYNEGILNSYCPNKYIVGAKSLHNEDENFKATNECFESYIS